MDSFLKELWYDLAGKPYVELPKNMPPIEELRKTEWSQGFEFNMELCFRGPLDEEFISLMRNRLIMGAFRYGLMAKQDYGLYDLIGQVRKKVHKYFDTKNLEYLVDAANNCLLVYVHWGRKGKRIKRADILLYYSASSLEMGLRAFETTGELEYIVWCGVFIMTIFMCAREKGYRVESTDDVDHAEIKV